MRQFSWAAYAMYFLGGMTAVLFGSVLPELLKHYNITYTTGGLIVFLQAIGFLAGVPLVSYLMSRFHYNYILSSSALAVAIAQLTFLILPPLGWVYGLAMLNGAGASALETAVASYIMEKFIGQRAVFMSRLEVSFGLGALGLPVLASVLIVINAWTLSFLVIGIFALLLAVVWLVLPINSYAVEAGKQLDAETFAPPEFKTRRTKYVILSLFLSMTFIYVGVEGGLNSFLPSLFTSYLKALPYFASLSSSVFWIAMVFGRMAIGWMARRLNYELYLLWSVLGTIVFLVGLSLFNHLLICFCILFCLGIAMSAIYSITMVYANHTFPGMAHSVTSLVTACAGIGGAVFPAVIGYAMDHLQPNRILWMLVGFAILQLFYLVTIFGSLHIVRLRLKSSL